MIIHLSTAIFKMIMSLALMYSLRHDAGTSF